MSEARVARLGDLFERTSDRLGEHDEEPPVLSLSKHDGFVPADEYFDRRIASTRLDQYRHLPPGAWAYSTIHIDEGAIARNELGYAGVISPMYTTMRWISEVDDPRYLAILLRLPSMIATYRALARGTVNRRRSLPWEAFADIEVPLPTLAIQQSTVDLLNAVRAHRITVAREAAAARHLYQSYLASTLTADGTPRPLSELVRVESRRERTDAEATYRVAGVLRSGEGLIDKGVIRGSETTYSSLFRLQPGQLVMRKLTAWEGPITVVPDAFAGYVVSPEFPTFNLDMEGLHPDFMRHVCRWPGLWSEMKRRLTGSVQRRQRLSPSQLLEIALHLPSAERQAVVLPVLDTLYETAVRLEREAQAVDSLSRALASEFVSGARDLPASYEEIMRELREEAA